MALENMKSRLGNIIKTWNNFNVYGKVTNTNQSPNRMTNKKPITQKINVVNAKNLIMN